MKTVVIGLDGANWDHLAPWLEQGALPNLKALMEDGAWSYSASELPYVTFPNWKCYSTGKNPGKLGVFWWEQVDVANRRVSMPNSRSFKGNEVFDYLSGAGRRCCVINMPTTYPPKRIENGAIIAGGPGCADHGYTHPRDLEGSLQDRFGYRPHPRNSITRRQEYIREVLDLIDLRFEVGKAFLEEFDFLQITVFYINMLQHFFWRDQAVIDGWRRIDRHLGDLMNRGCRIALVSDHGCGRIQRVFNINAWLMERGHLVLKKDALRTRMPAGLKRMVSIMRRDKVLRNKVSRWIPKDLIRKIGLFQDELRGSLKFQMIDWDRTIAFASGQGPLYLNPGSGRFHEGLRDELAEELSRLRDPRNGLAPIRNVFRREQVYKGDYAHLGPDLVAEQNEGYYINGRVGRSAFFENPDRWKAENSRQGIFLLYGEGIVPGHKGETRIVDIAPTLLHWHDLSVPADMDGSVREEFLAEKAPVLEQTTGSIGLEPAGMEGFEQDEEVIRRQLINLGYME